MSPSKSHAKKTTGKSRMTPAKKQPVDASANIVMRMQLMKRLQQRIKETSLSQRDVAKLLGIRQPRIAEIMSSKIECFSVDTLLKYLDQLGEKISLSSASNGSPANVLTLLQSWLDDDSGYDEAVWTNLKSNLENNRLSKRKLFSE